MRACCCSILCHMCVFQVELEGSVCLWENPNGIPSADISWLKEDTERGLFTPVQTYKDVTGVLKRRRVIKSDCMWFCPPEPPGYARALFFAATSFCGVLLGMEVLSEVSSS